MGLISWCIIGTTKFAVMMWFIRYGQRCPCSTPGAFGKEIPKWPTSWLLNKNRPPDSNSNCLYSDQGKEAHVFSQAIVPGGNLIQQYTIDSARQEGCEHVILYFNLAGACARRRAEDSWSLIEYCTIIITRNCINTLKAIVMVYQLQASLLALNPVH